MHTGGSASVLRRTSVFDVDPWDMLLVVMALVIVAGLWYLIKESGT